MIPGWLPCDVITAGRFRQGRIGGRSANSREARGWRVTEVIIWAQGATGAYVSRYSWSPKSATTRSLPPSAWT
jgi:hypothetical protein